MHTSRACVPLLLSVAVFPLTSHAAASLLVDDAGITDAHHCQLESWVRHTDAGQEWTTVPACTVAGTEYSLGITRAPGTPTLQWAAGAKRVLRDIDQRRWGLALSAGIGGNAHQPRSDDWDLNAPLTVALGSGEHVRLHVNLGWAHRDGVSGRTEGVGLEAAATPHWSVLAETARDPARHRSSQAGIRRHLGQAGSVDLLLGRVHHQPDSGWITLGFNLAFPR